MAYTIIKEGPEVLVADVMIDGVAHRGLAPHRDRKPFHKWWIEKLLRANIAQDPALAVEHAANGTIPTGYFASGIKVEI